MSIRTSGPEASPSCDRKSWFRALVCATLKGEQGYQDMVMVKCSVQFTTDNPSVTEVNNQY